MNLTERIQFYYTMIWIVLVICVAVSEGQSLSNAPKPKSASVEDFNGKVLEIMTKFAQDVSSLNERLKAIDSNMKALQTDVDNLKSDNSYAKSFDSKVTQMQSDSKSASVELGILKTKLDFLEESVTPPKAVPDFVKQSVSALEANVSSLHDMVTRLNTLYGGLSYGVRGNTGGVRFDVRCGGGNFAITSNTVMRLPVLTVNIGEGYNVDTGEFTAPQSGTYLFWAQVTKKTGSYLALHLNHNGDFIAYSFNEEEGYVTGTFVTAARVEAGDKLYVRIFGATLLYAGYHSHFGGMLLL